MQTYISILCISFVLLSTMYIFANVFRNELRNVLAELMLQM